MKFYKVYYKKPLEGNIVFEILSEKAIEKLTPQQREKYNWKTKKQL